MKEEKKENDKEWIKCRFCGRDIPADEARKGGACFPCHQEKMTGRSW